MRFLDFIELDESKQPLKLKCEDKQILVLKMFLSPKASDTTTVFTITDVSGKKFPLGVEKNVFYWEYTSGKEHEDILNCEYIEAEILEIPSANSKENYAMKMNGKYVVMDENNKILLSAKTFPDLMYMIIENWDKYPILDFPEPNSKKGQDIYYKYNPDYFENY